MRQIIFEASGNAATLMLLATLAMACKPIVTPPLTGDEACADGGELVASVYGAIEGELEWRGADIECEGMPRPHGEGARLRFAGPALPGSDSEKLAFIIALPDLREGETGKELAAGVTLMEVDAGRFFSTPEQTGCWTDIDRQDRVKDGDGTRPGNHYRVSGLLYCVSPLAELNGSAGVSLRDLRFTGRLNWAVPE